MEAKPEKPPYLPHVVKFLRSHFGASFSFADPEFEEVAFTVRDISAKELRAVLNHYRDAVRTFLLVERERRLNSFVGGPVNGQPHWKMWPGEIKAFRAARARWAVYEVGEDGKRAFFLGYATSRRNARQKRLLPAEVKAKRR